MTANISQESPALRRAFPDMTGKRLINQLVFSEVKILCKKIRKSCKSTPDVICFKVRAQRILILPLLYESELIGLFKISEQLIPDAPFFTPCRHNQTLKKSASKPIRLSAGKSGSA